MTKLRRSCDGVRIADISDVSNTFNACSFSHSDLELLNLEPLNGIDPLPLSSSRFRLGNFRGPILDVNRLGRKAQDIQIEILAPSGKFAHVFNRYVKMFA